MMSLLAATPFEDVELGEDPVAVPVLCVLAEGTPFPIKGCQSYTFQATCGTFHTRTKTTAKAYKSIHRDLSIVVAMSVHVLPDLGCIARIANCS